MEAIKEIFTVGAEFEGYYGNGEFRGTETVTKVTEKSCWIDGCRNSWKTIKAYFEKGIYRIPEAGEVAEEATAETEEEKEPVEGSGNFNPVFYESMYDYVQNADLSYYEIMDGTIRETPFVEEIKPFEDPDFILVADVIEHEEKCYVHVNFGENETSYLLESALYDTVYLRYIEQSHGHYVAENGRVYETEEDAKDV